MGPTELAHSRTRKNQNGDEQRDDRLTQDDGCVTRTAGHDPGDVHGVHEGDQTVSGQQAVRWLQGHDAAQGARVPSGAACVGAQTPVDDHQDGVQTEEDAAKTRECCVHVRSQVAGE